MTIVGDDPIREPSEDRLGRAPLAESLARQIQRADASEGLVVGVLGPWGSGKTSFVNLVRHYLTSARVPVRDFNPWLFSGTENLVQAGSVRKSKIVEIATIFEGRGLGRETDFLYSETDLVRSGHGM